MHMHLVFLTFARVQRQASHQRGQRRAGLHVDLDDRPRRGRGPEVRQVVRLVEDGAAVLVGGQRIRGPDVNGRLAMDLRRQSEQRHRREGEDDPHLCVWSAATGVCVELCGPVYICKSRMGRVG